MSNPGGDSSVKTVKDLNAISKSVFICYTPISYFYGTNSTVTGSDGACPDTIIPSIYVTDIISRSTDGKFPILFFERGCKGKSNC